jgi:hypothetical protein
MSEGVKEMDHGQQVWRPFAHSMGANRRGEGKVEGRKYDDNHPKPPMDEWRWTNEQRIPKLDEPQGRDGGMNGRRAILKRSLIFSEESACCFLNNARNLHHPVKPV